MLCMCMQLRWPLPKRKGLISTKRILTSRWGTSLVSKPYYTKSGKHGQKAIGMNAVYAYYAHS